MYSVVLIYKTFKERMYFTYKYRKDPVPYTRKWRGGPYQSPPHTTRINRMYGNPDYKYFNRGSKRDIPQWWDDKSRCVQRSWKAQSKARHQWQRGKKDKYYGYIGNDYFE